MFLLRLASDPLCNPHANLSSNSQVHFTREKSAFTTQYYTVPDWSSPGVRIIVLFMYFVLSMARKQGTLTCLKSCQSVVAGCIRNNRTCKLEGGKADVTVKSLWTWMVRPLYTAIPHALPSEIRYNSRASWGGRARGAAHERDKAFLAHAMEAYRLSRGIAPLILNFGTLWERVVNFKPRPLYRGERSPLPTE